MGDYIEAMYNQINIKRFFSTIFVILTSICLVYMVLLWQGLDDIEKRQAELIKKQSNVALISDIRFHTSEIQQNLTDVGATHRQLGFQAAAEHLAAAKKDLSTLANHRPDLQSQLVALETQINDSYQQGVTMAWDYLNNGLEAGNQKMIILDMHCQQINEDLTVLANQLKEQWQQGLQANQNSFQSNRILVLSSLPIILAFFAIFLFKIRRLLYWEMDRLNYRTTQLNTILDTAASAIITVDHSGIILSFNHAAEKIFGYKLHEIIGHNVTILMPDELAKQHEEYLRDFQNENGSKIIGKGQELIAKHKNGKIIPILLRVNPMKVDDELFFSGVIDDISETKTLQAQLGQAQKLEAIGQLASGVAHEINTPIQYIGDNVSAVLDNFTDIIKFCQSLSTLGDSAFQDQLQQLYESHDLEFILADSPKALKQTLEGVERVAEIVKAMKVLSHIDSDQTPQSINLQEALHNTLTISRNSYKYIATIETDFAEDVANIECYPSELNQVFLNLIINASHAIEERGAGHQGIIKIATRQLNKDSIEITIADNGAGIPKAIQEKVFNLFFTTKEVGKGTGQGLSLAHTTIVEKHHGKLFFESSVGVGTTFYIQLPKVQTL